MISLGSNRKVLDGAMALSISRKENLQKILEWKEIGGFINDNISDSIASAWWSKCFGPEVNFLNKF